MLPTFSANGHFAEIGCSGFRLTLTSSEFDCPPGIVLLLGTFCGLRFSMAAMLKRSSCAKWW